MALRNKVLFWIAVLIVVAASVAVTFLLVRRQPVILQGAVIRQDSDPAKEIPIADARVSTLVDNISVETRSDGFGFFRLVLRKGTKLGRPITLTLEHPDYFLLTLHESLDKKIYLARMVSSAPPPAAESKRPLTQITNVLLRYTTNVATDVNVGSTVKSLQVVNKGNIPCDHQQPCSPDGLWKATSTSATLDAGVQNEFRNIRLSCIAGPCPFTKVGSDDLSRPTRNLKISILDWSDTTTFLLEAEVFHTSIANMIRNSYPAIFGRTFNFTLPGDSEGPSIEADLNGSHIIFPLGPKLYLSWANCAVSIGERNTLVFRCELKPEYRF